MNVSAADTNPIVYIPLDNRPVSLQLPQMLADFAGINLVTPPPKLLGVYITPGNAPELGTWLTGQASARNFVVSSDMLAYGGLVASRLPGVNVAHAVRLLAPLARLRRLAPYAEIDTFGTVMRLAPTGLPAIGDAAGYFAAGDAAVNLTAYASLPAPPVSAADREVAVALRHDLGPLLRAYMQARRRNRRVDIYLMDLLARGKIDRLVLGQDDAGVVGLHLVDIAELRAHAAGLGLRGDQVSIEGGTDELGMALLARSLAHRLHWVPRIAVTYSRPGAQVVQDRIEYEPIDSTISKLVDLCGGIRVASNQHPDINLFVYVAQTKREERDAFVASMHVLTTNKQPVTVADVSFIDGTIAEQSELAQALMADGIAGSVDGFASWNTNANSVGTALAAAIFTTYGKRTEHYNAKAHAAFLLDRYADDYAYRLIVRSKLTRVLHQEGLAQTYLLPGSAVRMESDARVLLWQELLALRDRIFPDFALCRATITLPWQRTFEVQLQIQLKQQSSTVETMSNERTTCAASGISPSSL